MKIENLHTYKDPDDFLGGEVTYPCNTQFMVYNPLLHQYFLTEEALNYYGIDVNRKYITDNVNNKTDEFIEKVSKKIYDYIMYKVGKPKFQVILYRIATSQGANIDKYAFRKKFQDILVAEAKWLIANGDSAEYSAMNLHQGKPLGIKPEEEQVGQEINCGPYPLYPNALRSSLRTGIC